MKKLTQQEIEDSGVETLDEGEVVYRTTIEELARLGYGTICGSVGNNCYANIATKYPDLEVIVGMIEQELATISPLIQLNDMVYPVGWEIEKLALEGEGSLRFEENCPYNYDGGVWYYFETE